MKASEETTKETQMKVSKYFADKTDELLNEKFEGFEFKIGEDKSLVYKPGDVKAIKEQNDFKNFMGKFFDENGLLKEAKEFHRAMSLAANPDKVAAFFYEQGKADMAKDIEKDSKNIDMTRQSTSQVSKGGFQVRDVSDSTGARQIIK